MKLTRQEREELVERLVATCLPLLSESKEGALYGALTGANFGATAGQLYGAARVLHAAAPLTRSLNDKKRKPFKGKVPHYVQHITTREDFKKWTADKRNVNSKIPVIGRPIKRFRYHLAAGSVVPKAGKEHKFKAQNAFYVPPDSHEGRAAVVAHRSAPDFVVRHELGHAADFRGKNTKEVEKQYKGGKLKTFIHGYEHSPTYQAEVRAWDKAGIHKDHPVRKAALRTYKHGAKMSRYVAAGAAAGAVIGGIGGAISG